MVVTWGIVAFLRHVSFTKKLLVAVKSNRKVRSMLFVCELDVIDI